MAFRREVLRCAMIPHQVLLRGAAQCFLLNSALCLTDVVRQSVIEITFHLTFILFFFLDYYNYTHAHTHRIIFFFWDCIRYLGPLCNTASFRFCHIWTFLLSESLIIFTYLYPSHWALSLLLYNCDILLQTSVTLDDVFSFLVEFCADESLCRGTQIWNQVSLIQNTENKMCWHI